MRSITRMGNQTNEDVEHPFKAVATDNRGSRPDTYVVHFTTPFWDPAHNPMATRSTLVPGWAQFRWGKSPRTPPVTPPARSSSPTSGIHAGGRQ